MQHRTSANDTVLGVVRSVVGCLSNVKHHDDPVPNKRLPAVPPDSCYWCGDRMLLGLHDHVLVSRPSEPMGAWRTVEVSSYSSGHQQLGVGYFMLPLRAPDRHLCGGMFRHSPHDQARVVCFVAVRHRGGVRSSYIDVPSWSGHSYHGCVDGRYGFGLGRGPCVVVGKVSGPWSFGGTDGLYTGHVREDDLHPDSG